MIKSEPLSRNSEFFEELYSTQNPLYFRLHSIVSFNQRSKAQSNLRALDDALKMLQRQFPPASVLDFGCGFGVSLFSFPKTVAIAGVDISANAIRNCKRLSTMLRRNGEFYVSDGTTSFPFDDNRFELVIASHSLEHIENERFVFSEMIRCARPGGLLLINVPINEVVNDPKHVRKYSTEKLSVLFSQHGLLPVLFQQSNKWDSFFFHSALKHDSRFAHAVIRSVKGVLAVLPESVRIWMEDIFLGAHEYQQLIGIGRKP